MNAKKVWIGTSWKMNKTRAEAEGFANGLVEFEMPKNANIQRFVIPPFTHIRHIKNLLTDTDILVGAQNMHWDDAGAWTGEISPTMLTDCRCDIVELGHSERRAFFNETDETVGRKVAAALRHNLSPLICIGETFAERENNRTAEVLQNQVHHALQYVDTNAHQTDILFAYEPVWAIGDTGIPATSQYANAQHDLIKQTALAVLNRPVPCLYGGSVNSDNCAEFIQCEHIDGLFIGRSAWELAGYLSILNKCAAVL
ncbi:triosephosphate isomerase [Amylibacter ulvae]|uniref:Triosephosphate isomerase n=1 Tax=Paramylibacter ulvae TaxID=1651968 RepID=A0ABQ3CV32_9RHOB|nr:triose-phosphate isomerase [Amylibacter ulvae]GHA44262.1 triosephosphate isomerase [Amylibacter ulvae]